MHALRLLDGRKIAKEELVMESDMLFTSKDEEGAAWMKNSVQHKAKHTWNAHKSRFSTRPSLLQR